MESLLDHFAVHTPRLVADTVIADIWQVTQADGTPAALKVYKTGSADEEGAGFDLLDVWDGNGAARLLGRMDGAALVEWLDGPSLGDLVRDGRDDDATQALGHVALQLHRDIPKVPTSLPVLAETFQPLMTATFAPTCPAQTRATIRAAQRIANRLLTTQIDIRPLHGDLHHDNIKGNTRGYLAFDAKGILGERCYDLANALRNPIGAEDHYCQPEVITRRVAIWTSCFDVTPNRLLQWAAAHSALSRAWSNKGVFDDEPQADIALIDTFLGMTP